ncbi:MAG: DUF6597 domain-containing transcriptional factor [Pyrinomonadaceae bacterium]
MLYRSYTPAPPLGDFVDNLWLYDDYTAPHFRERIMPSGTIELVINLRDDELRIYDAVQPESYKRFPGSLVSGTYRGFFVSDTAEEASIMGVHFKPGGAFPFLGVSAGELAMDCGYFDQSHMIRDFLAFSGFSPADFLRHKNDLTQQGVHIKHNHLPLAA